MIAKLMSRKKSYERIMRLEDGPSGGRHSELKNSGNALMSGPRNPPGVSALSRAQPGGASRKQLQYYDSTP